MDGTLWMRTGGTLWMRIGGRLWMRMGGTLWMRISTMLCPEKTQYIVLLKYKF